MVCSVKEKALKIYYGTVHKRYLVYGYFENISKGLWVLLPSILKLWRLVHPQKCIFTLSQ